MAVREIDRPRDLDRSRRYTKEFKRHAVALVRSFGKTVTEVARQIGVSLEGLRNRVKQDPIDPWAGDAGRADEGRARGGAPTAHQGGQGEAASSGCGAFVRLAVVPLSPIPLRCRSGPSRPVAAVGVRVAVRAMTGITAPLVGPRGNTCPVMLLICMRSHVSARRAPCSSASSGSVTSRPTRPRDTPRARRSGSPT
ncbi:transposase [Streptomyces sp. NPDC055722]